MILALRRDRVHEVAHSLLLNSRSTPASVAETANVSQVIRASRGNNNSCCFHHLSVSGSEGDKVSR